MTDWRKGPWEDGTLAARLAVLWTAGTPTGEIARKLGITKNALIAKAHRLGLPSRPSPIQPRKHAARPRVTGSTLPPLASEVRGRGKDGALDAGSVPQGSPPGMPTPAKQA